MEFCFTCSHLEWTFVVVVCSVTVRDTQFAKKTKYKIHEVHAEHEHTDRSTILKTIKHSPQHCYDDKAEQIYY